MGRRTLIAAGLAAGALAGLTAAPSCSESDVIIQRPDGGTACGSIYGPACGAGFACVNSICTPTCTSASGCPSGSYCENPNDPVEQVCAPVGSGACQNISNCPYPRLCRDSLCTSTVFLGDGGISACALGQEPNDGCGPDALCYLTSSGPPAIHNCIALPACDVTGGCPIPLQGAVCNDRPDGGKLFAPKQRLCLYAYCESTTDCPRIAPHCVHIGTESFGQCFAGNPGDQCRVSTDCISGNCANPDAGPVGNCQ